MTSMPEPKPKDKAGGGNALKDLEPREYRKFKALLRKVVKAPPMPKRASGKLTQSDVSDTP